MQSYIRNAVNGAEGEGASVDRLFPVQGMMNFDPFVLWDDFTISAGAGFPDHPHRGSSLLAFRWWHLWLQVYVFLHHRRL